jgi:hypothetical protein
MGGVQRIRSKGESTMETSDREYSRSLYFCKVSEAPPGTQGAQIDIRKAYRNIPTAFEHLPHLTVSLYNKSTHRQDIFIDRVHPFGLKSAGGNLGLAVDASLDILTRELGVDFFAKWVDDIVPLRFPKASSRGSIGGWSYGVELKQITDGLESLGWPLSEEKIADFGSQITYIGFTWDFDAKTVFLPEEKRLRFQDRVMRWIQKANTTGVTGDDTAELLGSLVHVAEIHRIGRSYLPETYKFLSSYPLGERSVRHLPWRDCIDDMVTWHALLSVPHAFRSLKPMRPLNVNIWVDASSGWGIGLMVGERWRAWKLLPGWKADGREIGWAEAVALEVAIRHIAGMGVNHRQVKIHSDNQGSIGQYRKGKGANRHTNKCIRRAVSIMMKKGFDVELEWVRSADNRADALSRGVPHANAFRLENTFDLPVELRGFVQEV